jgi:hypothetical protein
MKPTRIPAVFVTIALALLPASIVAAAPLKSPDDVKTVLRLIVQVSNDFKRQITNKNFKGVPREYMEFTEGADALRDVTKDEPAAFKSKVEARLKTALAAYKKVSDMSATTPDADKLMAQLNKAIPTMNAIFDLFPADLRPDPNAPPGGGRGLRELQNKKQ